MLRKIKENNMVKEVKLKSYIILVPPVFGSKVFVPSKYPAPGESYNHKQMVDVLTIFDKRWKAAGSPVDREPYALSSSKDGIVENDPLRFTHDQIYSEMAADAYIESVAEKESSNLLLKELLSLDNSFDSDDDIDIAPHGGGKTCERKTTNKRSSIRKK
jgi:hypothetical protein